MDGWIFKSITQDTQTLASASATLKQCHAFSVTTVPAGWASFINCRYGVSVFFCVCVCVSLLRWVYLKSEVLFNGCESKGWTQDCHGVIGRRNTGGCWFTMIVEFKSNHLRSVFLPRKKGENRNSRSSQANHTSDLVVIRLSVVFRLLDCPPCLLHSLVWP